MYIDENNLVILIFSYISLIFLFAWLIIAPIIAYKYLKGTEYEINDN